MSARKLPSADGWFVVRTADATLVGLTKNGICYTLDDTGAATPVVIGDQFVFVGEDAVAVRRGQHLTVFDPV